jgi:hypothetical protein
MRASKPQLQVEAVRRTSLWRAQGGRVRAGPEVALHGASEDGVDQAAKVIQGARREHVGLGDEELFEPRRRYLDGSGPQARSLCRFSGCPTRAARTSSRKITDAVTPRRFASAWSFDISWSSSERGTRGCEGGGSPGVRRRPPRRRRPSRRRSRGRARSSLPRPRSRTSGGAFGPTAQLDRRRRRRPGSGTSSVPLDGQHGSLRVVRTRASDAASVPHRSPENYPSSGRHLFRAQFVDSGRCGSSSWWRTRVCPGSS